MSLIKINQSKVQEIANQKRITELQKLLNDSDYKVMPDYDKPNETVKVQRQAWREEIRKLGG
jgi:hypothetical protein